MPPTNQKTTIFLKTPSHRFRGGRCATLAVYEHTTDAATTAAWIYTACQRHLGKNVMYGLDVKVELLGCFTRKMHKWKMVDLPDLYMNG